MIGVDVGAGKRKSKVGRGSRVGVTVGLSETSSVTNGVGVFV